MTVYEIWYETNVGPILSTYEKAIAYLEQDGEKYDPYPSSGYPCIKHIIVDDEEVFRDR